MTLFWKVHSLGNIDFLTKYFVQVDADIIEMDSVYVFPFKYFAKHYAMLDHRLIIGPSLFSSFCPASQAGSEGAGQR